MLSPSSRQISILLPEDIIVKAQEKAKVERRPDGLKVSTAYIIRQWVLKGVERDGR